jgi:hypothetical protein
LINLSITSEKPKKPKIKQKQKISLQLDLPPRARREKIPCKTPIMK